MERSVGHWITWAFFAAGAAYALVTNFHLTKASPEFFGGAFVGVLSYMVIRSLNVFFKKGYDAMYDDPASDWPIARIAILLLGFQGFIAIGLGYFSHH